MQDRLIEASYLWTEEEFVTATRHAVKSTEGPIIKLGIPFLIAFFGFAGLILLRAMPYGFAAGVFCLTMSGMFVYLFYLGGRERGSRSSFRRAGVLNQADQKVVFLVDDRWIRITTAGSEHSFVWELVPTVIHVPEGFLVRCGGFYRWIPNHAFRDEDDRDAFAELASRRATKFIRMV